MKITTADCINYLVQYWHGVGDQPNSPAHWKRRSKKKIRDSIVRTFENIKFGVMAEVTESDGKITGFVQLGMQSKIPVIKTKKSKYVYAWVKMNSNDPMRETTEGYICISLRSVWEDEGCSSDYLDEDILDALYEKELFDLDETTFEIPKGKKEEIQKIVENEPLLAHDPEFEEFINNLGE